MKLLAGMLATISAFAQTPTSKGVNFYTVEREIAFKKTVTAALKAQASIVQDANVDAYLEKLGRDLRPADAAFEYRFVTYKGRRLGSPDEVVAIPGGTIFIPLQSLADAPNDASIAMKIAHAIAHVELRTIPGISMGAYDVRPVPNAALEAEADKMAASNLSRRQEDAAGFDAARTSARAALER